MFSISKSKIILICVSTAGVFILGRATAPKPKPEIKMIDNTKSIENAIENTRKQMTEDLQKQVVLEKHSTKSKEGMTKTYVKEIITYNKNSTQNIDSKIQNNSKSSNRQTVDVKHKNLSTDYTFMIGRSFSDPKYDYLASVGIPLLSGIKANVGYEFNNKIIFIGTTFNF